MAARLQKLVTLGGLLLLTLWVVWFANQGNPWMAAAGPMAVLLVYGGVLGLEFILLSRVHRDDPTPKPNLRQMFSAWWHEALIAPTVFCWNQPFQSQRYPDFLPENAETRGVVLVHGFLCNRGFWNSWMPRLRALQVPHAAVTMEPLFGSIASYAESIDEAVRRVTELTGKTPVLVGHSMGGIAIRSWLHQYADLTRVHHIVTVGSPHRGTWLARFATSPNAKQMSVGHPWRRAMESAETPDHTARFTCFYSHCDNVVFPASNASLPGADNRHIDGMAHVQLNENPAVFAEVLSRVSSPSLREP